MSSSRVHSSFTGTPALLAIARASTDVVVGQPPAEAAAGAHHVHGDVVRLHPERLATRCVPASRRLARRPDLELAVLEVRDAVLRLERRVRDERIRVGGFDHLRGAARARASASPSVRSVNAGCCFDELVRPSGRSRRCSARRRAFVPGDLQLLARRLRLPPAVGDDRDAAVRQAERAPGVRRSTMNACRTPGMRLDLVEVGADRPCRRTPGTSRTRRTACPARVKSMLKIGLPVTIVGMSTPAAACR